MCDQRTEKGKDDEKFQKFEISIEDFSRKDEETAANPENIIAFSHFCSNLHKKIEWRIKHGDSKIYANFLSNLLKPNKEFIDMKKAFVGLCEKFQFEFLLLYDLSKDDTIL